MAQESWDLTTPEGIAAARAAGLPVPDGPSARGPSGNASSYKGQGYRGQRSRKRTYNDLTTAQQAFVHQALAFGLPEPVPEYRFDDKRRWRFDWLFDGWCALEIQGGLFVGGRHVQGAALKREYEKINAAQIAGYVVLLVTPDQVQDGEVFALVKKALER